MTFTELIDKITEVLSQSNNFKKVTIEGDKTNIIIEKPKDDSKGTNEKESTP